MIILYAVYISVDRRYYSKNTPQACLTGVAMAGWYFGQESHLIALTFFGPAFGQLAFILRTTHLDTSPTFFKISCQKHFFFFIPFSLEKEWSRKQHNFMILHWSKKAREWLQQLPLMIIFLQNKIGILFSFGGGSKPILKMPGFQPRLPWQSLPNYVATSPPSPVCLSTCTCKKAGEEASSVAHFARLGLPCLASLCLACTPIEHLSTCQGSRTFWPHHCNIATLSTGITSNIHIQANSGLNNNILESKYILFVIGVVI